MLQNVYAFNDKAGATSRFIACPNLALYSESSFERVDTRVRYNCHGG